MKFLFAICPGCKSSITLPEGYVSYGPWLSAHQKTCPQSKTPKVVARVRTKREKGVEARVERDSELQTGEFLAEVGARLGARLINEALNTFFGGRVKP